MDEAAAGERLDRFLAGLPSVRSRKRARDAIDSGKVRVDGREVAGADRAQVLAIGSHVEIDWNRPGSARRPTRGRLALERHGLRIVHQDEDVLVIDKPPGLLTDTATQRQRREEMSVRGLLAQWLRSLGQEPVIVHRIDRDTSGLVVVARSARAGEHLREQFRAHRPRRVYWALVAGAPPAERGRFADAMRWDAERRMQCPTTADDPRGVLASASYRVLERLGASASVLEIELDTGRRNQIRLHCQLAGFPLWGERQYVDRSARRDERGATRQALHAWRLAFVHPASGRTLSFESPLPPDLLRLRQRLKG